MDEKTRSLIWRLTWALEHLHDPRLIDHLLKRICELVADARAALRQADAEAEVMAAPNLRRMEEIAEREQRRRAAADAVVEAARKLSSSSSAAMIRSRRLTGWGELSALDSALRVHAGG